MGHRGLPLAISGALALAAVVVAAHAYLLLSQRGYPYEAWDEIATSNYAAALDSPGRYRVYAYGSLDTFLHVLAQAAFERFTDTGKTTVRHSYSNNVPPSLDNPFLVHAEKTWAGTDYGYFRGLNYRDAIFIARDIYVVAILALGCALGGLAIYLFGAQAPPLLFASLLLITTPLFAEQAPQAVPSAISCLLASALFLAALAGVMQARPRLFALAAILFALALNMKIDVALLGIFLVAAYAAALFLAGASLRSSAALSGKLLAIFLLVLVIGRPGIVFNLADELAIQHGTLSILSSSDNMFHQNFPIFARFLDEGLWSLKGRGLPASWGLGVVAAALALFLLLLAMQRDFSPAKKLLVGALPLLALAILWAVPILVATKLYPRYFINGAGVFAVIIGLSIVLALRQPRTGPRWVGFMLLAAVCGVSLLRLLEVHESGRTLAAALSRAEGLDPVHSRNRASLEMVRWIRQGKYPPEVLVDQHSYTELGVFARNGIKATYVNLYNYEEILRQVSKPTLVLYVPASGYRAEDRRWNENRRWSKRPINWAGYAAALEKLPKLMAITGNVMDSMAIAPVNAFDGVVVAEAGAPGVAR